MSSSKLTEILHQLSPRQRNRLREYIHSDYFNKHTQVRLLCDWLLNHLDDSLDKEQIFRHLYGQQMPYDPLIINHLFSYGLELVIQFLGLEYWQENPTNNLLAAIAALRQYPLEKHLTSAARLHQRLHQRLPFADTQRHWERFRFHAEMDAAFLLQPRRVYDAHLQEKSDALDVFYIAEKLKIACDMTNRNIVIKADYRCGLLPEIENVLALQPDYLAFPAVRIYYTILQMLRKNEDGDYHQLKKDIETYIHDFSVTDIQGICDYAQNYCIRKINSGQSQYYDEFLNLYKFQLHHHIIFRNGYLEEWDYKNIVTAGIRLKDFDWTERFIRDNQAALRPQVRENAYTYNLAAFFYATKQYRQALQLLQNVDFTDTSYLLGAKIIQLKSYYELHELAALDALADSFRIFIHRSKDLSEYRQQANLHFLALTKKMGRLREHKAYMPRKKWLKQWQKLADQMAQTAPLANAEWLNEVLNALHKEEKQ